MIRYELHRLRGVLVPAYGLGARDFRIGVAAPDETAGDRVGRQYRAGWRAEQRFHLRSDR
jgi:hypothetical protein